MRILLGFLFLLAAAPATATADSADLLAESELFSFHDNVWINEHHFLFQTAKHDADAEVLEGLDEDDSVLLRGALEHYRETLIEQDLLFDRELFGLKRWLAAHPGDLPERVDGEDGEELQTTVDWLRRVSDVYIRHFRPQHSARNAATLEANLPAIRKYEAAIADRMAKLADSDWPEYRIRVDISYYTNWAGSYTTTRPRMHIVMRSEDEGPPGDWLEILFHEAGHGLIGGRNGTVAETIASVAEELGQPVPRNMWHAILFYVSGRVVQDRIEADTDQDYQLCMAREEIFYSYYPHLTEHFEPYVQGEVDLPTAVGDTMASFLAATVHTGRIGRIKKGLRPANVIEGDSAWTLEERMEHYGVPGVGIAVIENHKIAWFEVFGQADRETGAPVRPDTLFQAGSISKPVAAFGAMTMVHDGSLGLDADINDKLTSWKLPENEFTSENAVTLTHLMTHTGGLTVHGFPGYAADEPVPTLGQVLDGSGPANTEAIRVDTQPGEGWRYSGGGYTVMQQMMIDVAGEPFPELMQERVLGPAGMNRSTYLQPLPPELLKHAAAGVLPDGTAVPGKRHTYPEMAAAGLWTTAEDLARFAVEVQLALKGKSDVLSQEMAAKMVEPVVPGFGRGFGLDSRGEEVYFQHGGWDEGFCAQLTAHRDQGHGVAVMINSNHPQFIGEVIRGVAMEYGWDGYSVYQRRPLAADQLDRYVGRYRYNSEQSFEVFREDESLFMRYTGSSPEELVPVGDERFVRRERPTPVMFTREDGATVFHFVTSGDERQSHEQLQDGEKLPRELLAAGSYKKALVQYRRLKDAGDDAAAEGYLNGSGIGLVQGKNLDLAIALFRVNCALYPDSANTWDSLGYAYRHAGDPKNALKYYRKALQVDPDFASAVQAVAELEEEAAGS